MKRYLLSFLFIIFSAALAFAAPVDPYAHLLDFENSDKDFFEKIAKGEKATYTICIDKTEDGKNVIDENRARIIFLDSLNNWKSWTNYYINKHPKKEDFTDIIDIIDIKDNLEEGSCLIKENGSVEFNADLGILFTNMHDQNNRAVGGHYYKSTIHIFVNNNFNNTERMIISLTHELGHAFGLADQYPGATYKGSFIYNSKVMRPSIMDKSKRVTCDDIDGLITSIYRILNKEKKFESFCQDGIFIKNGKGISKSYKPLFVEENYEYFDADIKVSYDIDLSDDSYILDITLKNFSPSEKSREIIQNMWFNVNDLKNWNKIQIQIHGKVLKEDPDQKLKTRYTSIGGYMRTPTGLWTLVMYDENGEPIQNLSIDYLISNNVQIPIINYSPNSGFGEKEKLHNSLTQKITNSLN